MSKPDTANKISFRQLIKGLGSWVNEEKAQKLDDWARQNGVDLSILNHRPQKSVKASILELSKNQEERAAIEEFLSSKNLQEFNQFLSKCSETSGWISSRKQMAESLYDLVNQMRENEALNTKCLAIASTAFGTCEDRTSLAYVQMITQKDLSQKSISEMTVTELLECTKKESVISYLYEKADAKINELRVIEANRLTRLGISDEKEIKNRALERVDDIEVYLAYLQAASDLGSQIPASSMLYTFCSKVSEEDLKDAVAEFGDPILRAAAHAYENARFKLHPEINRIILEETKDLDLMLEDGEALEDFEERIKAEQEVSTSRIIQKIVEIFAQTRELTNQSPAGSEVAVSELQTEGIRVTASRSESGVEVANQEQRGGPTPSPTMGPTSFASRLGNCFNALFGLTQRNNRDISL